VCGLRPSRTAARVRGAAWQPPGSGRSRGRSAPAGHTAGAQRNASGAWLTRARAAAQGEVPGAGLSLRAVGGSTAAVRHVATATPALVQFHREAKPDTRPQPPVDPARPRRRTAPPCRPGAWAPALWLPHGRQAVLLLRAGAMLQLRP